MTTAIITGIGTASPPYSISQKQSAAVARDLIHEDHKSIDALPALYRMTRVHQRGSVVLEGPSHDTVQQSFYPQADSAAQRGPSTQQRMERFAAAAGTLAIASASEALEDAGSEAADVTHLVTVTCTGFYAPGFDIELIERLRLPRDVERIQVGFMGCHAIINGLRTAKAIAESTPSACVLVVAVELCSLHYQYGWDTDSMVANAIFADGSGALVVRAAPKPSVPAAESSTTSNTHSLELAASRYPSLKATGSCWLPGTQDAMTWRVGNHGYQMTLAASVPTHIAENLPEFLESWLAKHQLSFADIGGWATHPGGPRVLTAVEDALQLSREAHSHSRDVLAAHGNMSSATLVFILKKMRESATRLPWLMLGFGPGLEIELALLA